MNISQIMSGSVISALAGDSLFQGVRLLEQHGFKHLPVVDDDGKLVGIVSDRDLKRASASDATTLEVHELHYLLDRVKLSEVMTECPFTVGSRTSIQHAAKIAAEHKLGCLPVVDNGKLKGIVTNGDFLSYVAAAKSA